jgi:hypothetical protein|tara:strand:+ start:509 stop:1072 length:564 start_codon:yes stop_codon:yes gene_type:complete
MKRRKNTIQERLVNLLNSRMALGAWYTYPEIQEFTAGYKEGTMSSVLSRCKSIGALEYNENSGDRRRLVDIKYTNILDFSKSYKTVSTNHGITQVICDKVKALYQVDFSQPEITTVLNLKDNTVADIINCEFNIRRYNDYWREIRAAKETENAGVSTTQNGLEDMASKIKDAVDDLVNTVWHLTSTK